MDFYEKLQHSVENNQSLLCVGLDPLISAIPSRYRSNSYDSRATTDELLAWNQAIIAETCTLVCAYKPNIAFYEALGTKGMSLLRKTLALIPKEIPIILDAKRGDIGSTAAAYAAACFEDLKVDAVTLNPYLGRDSLEPFLAFADKGLFVLCHTSNPGAQDFQMLEISDWQLLDREPNWPLYLHVARQAAQWSPQIGLVVGATYPEAMQSVRRVAPAAFILAPGVGAQGGDLQATMEAGLRPDRSGILIHVSRSISVAASHRDAADSLRNTINDARKRARMPTRLQSTKRVRSIHTARDSSATSIESIVPELADLGSIKFGEFKLASGMVSPFYIDLRLLVSRPTLLNRAAAAYAQILNNLKFDRIAGVPYAGLPIATAIALQTQIPMLYLRKEQKTHGTGKEIEGEWYRGERVVVIEDVITRGGSLLESVIRLRALGLIVEDAIVLIDREHDGEERLKLAGVRLHSIIGLSDMLHTLVDSGQLTEEKLQEVIRFVSEA